MAGLNDLLVIRRANNGQVDDASMPIEMREWFKKVYRQPTEPITTEPITTEQPINIDEYGETEDAIIADQIHQLEEQEKRSDEYGDLSEPGRFSDFQSSPMFQFGNKEPDFSQDMFSFDIDDRGEPNPRIFKNKEIGKAYVDNVLDTVFQYIPRGSISDFKKFRELMLHTAEKESKFGTDKYTYKYREIVPGEPEKGTVGHGGIQQVTTNEGFKRNLLINPGPTAQKMIKKLKEERGIDLNQFKDDVSDQPNTDIQNFLRTPFGSNFAASIIYINELEGVGEKGKAARNFFNNDKYDKEQFRNIFYKGNKKYTDVASILKQDKVKKLKSGGMVERNYYDYAPRNI